MELDMRSTAEDEKNLETINGVHDDNKPEKKKKLGGFKTMPFILANEICDRFAMAGFHANMITYLTQQLNLPMVQAANTLTNFSGTASFMPLLGAMLADSVAGRFWTIILGSIVYELGLISITTSAILPSLRPPPCPTQVNCIEASTTQLWVLYVSLLLTSLGSGGIRPCVVTFAADQFDMSKSKVEKRKWNFFNWYYFSMGCATLMALTIVVYVQDNVGWGWGLGIPSVAMAVSLIAFALGSGLYVRIKPVGSPLVRLAQVVVAATKKRKVVVPKDPTLLYQNKELDAPISKQGLLLHSEQFKWLDKAATVTEEEARSSELPNPWRLATVHRVEELKCITRILPVWSAGILVVTAAAHLHSFTILQARTMDRHLSHSFQIPPASLSVFSILSLLTGLMVYERVFVPFIRRFTGNPAGLTCLQRMGIGFVVNIIGTMVASFVEIKRKRVAALHHLLDKPKAVIPISVFWLVPQFCIHGIGEVFMSVGNLEFLYDQSPESMRTTATALYWVSISLGNYVGTMVVSIIHKYTGKEHNWLPGRNLNKGRLEYYYWVVSGIQVVNFVYFLVCAWRYTYKPVQEIVAKDIDEEDVDEMGNAKLNGEADLELANVDKAAP